MGLLLVWGEFAFVGLSCDLIHHNIHKSLFLILSLSIINIATKRVTSSHHDDESSISSKSYSSSVLMEDAMTTHSSTTKALPPQHYTPGDLDQAIESGNWEAVAASAAAIVGQGINQSGSGESERGVV